jgi:hypothetical protein
MIPIPTYIYNLQRAGAVSAGVTFASLTTTKNGTFSATLKGASGDIYIYWGDGSALETFTLIPGGVACTHAYGDASEKTIRIYGALASVTYLTVTGQALIDCNPSLFINLDRLNLYSNASLSMPVSLLSGMTLVTNVRLDSTLIYGDLEPLSALTVLNDFNITHSSITATTEHLSYLIGLKYLYGHTSGVTGSLASLSTITGFLNIRLYANNISMTDDPLPPWAGCVISLYDNNWTESEVGYFLKNMADGVGTGGAIDIAGDNANRAEPATDAWVAAIVAVRPLTVNEAP